MDLIIPNPVVKSRFSLLARAGGLRPYSPTLEGAGFYRPLTTEFRIKGDRSPHRSSLMGRQPNRKPCANILNTLNGNGPPVGIDTFFDNSQSQPGAGNIPHIRSPLKRLK